MSYIIDMDCLRLKVRPDGATIRNMIAKHLLLALSALLVSVNANSVEAYWELQPGVTIADLWGPDTQLLESAGLSWTNDARAVILYLQVGEELWRCPDFSNRDLQQGTNNCSRLKTTEN